MTRPQPSRERLARELQNKMRWDAGTNADFAFYERLADFILSREKVLVDALEEVIGWTGKNACYCLDEEEASRIGGKTCPTCIATVALDGVRGK